VRFHPTMEHVFATSDGQGRVCLRDTRMTFGPREGIEGIVQLVRVLLSVPVRRCPIAVQYNTKISRRPLQHLANPETSSIVFNRQGNYAAPNVLSCLSHLDCRNSTRCDYASEHSVHLLQSWVLTPLRTISPQYTRSRTRTPSQCVAHKTSPMGRPSRRARGRTETNAR